MSHRRRPQSHLSPDDPARLAVLHVLAGIGLSDRAISRHLKLSPGHVWRLRRRHSIPSGQVARERWGLPRPATTPSWSARAPFDLEDTDEL